MRNNKYHTVTIPIFSLRKPVFGHGIDIRCDTYRGPSIFNPENKTVAVFEVIGTANGISETRRRPEAEK